MEVAEADAGQVGEGGARTRRGADEEEEEQMGSELEGKTVALAGRLDRPREVLVEALEAAGATVKAKVTRKTDWLIAGADAGAPLAKAEALGVPTMGLAQLEALLEGGEGPVLAPPPPPTAPARTPFPPIVPRPRDGVFRERHPSGELAVEGRYAAGLRQGVWRSWFESGALKSEASFVDGLREGPERAFHESGATAFEGRNVGGHRRGPWEFHYASGAWKQRYEYDEEGRKHGPYAWDDEEGRPRARGAFLHGRRHGRWTWWNDGAHAKVERGYDAGRHEGDEAAWLEDGTLAWRRSWRGGKRHGEQVERWPSGAPKEESRWVDGFLDGERRRWSEEGEETVERWHMGLSEAVRDDAALREKVLRRVRDVAEAPNPSASDALGAAPWAERGPLLLHLWETGALELSAYPFLWEALAGAPMSSARWVALLRGVEGEPKGAHCPHLPGWPRSLDEAILRAYGDDPAPFDAAWDALSPAMRRGVDWVRFRWGREGAGETLRGLEEAFAERLVEGHGLQEDVWVVEHGVPVRRPLRALVEQPVWRAPRLAPTPAWEAFLDGMVDREALGRACLRRALREARKQAVGRVRLSALREAWPLATESEKVELLAQVALDANTEQWIEEALLRWDASDGATLARIALAIDDQGLRKWPVVACAMLRLQAEGAPIPDPLLDALRLSVVSGSGLHWTDQLVHRLPFEDVKRDPAFRERLVSFADPDVFFPRLDLVFRAFAGLDPRQRERVVCGQLAERYGAPNAAPLLRFVEDAALREEAMGAILAHELGKGDVVALGFGTSPFEDLPKLRARHEAAKDKEKRETLARAILQQLARRADAGEPWAPELDAFVRVDLVRERYAYPKIQPLLRKALWHLPPARAEAALRAGLTHREPLVFGRAFALLPIHPSAALLELACERLLAPEALPQEARWEVGRGLQALPEAPALVRWLLANGAPEALHPALEDAVGGRERFEALRAELGET